MKSTIKLVSVIFLLIIFYSISWADPSVTHDKNGFLRPAYIDVFPAFEAMSSDQIKRVNNSVVGNNDGVRLLHPLPIMLTAEEHQTIVDGTSQLERALRYLFFRSLLWRKKVFG